MTAVLDGGRWSRVRAARRSPMPLAGHLGEARKRLTRVAVAVALAAVVGYVLAEPVLGVLRTPVETIAAGRDATLNYGTVTGAFDLKLRIALFTAVVLASPVWLYQLFAFIAPGLTGREKRYTFGFLAAALPLFVAGCAGGLLLFPHMVELLAGFAPVQDAIILDASYYVDFVMRIVIAAGVAFTLPVVVVALNFLGVLPARRIARGWRIWLIAIVVFAGLVTPAADVLSMFIVAGAMIVLFAAAWLVAWLHDRRAHRRRGTGDRPDRIAGDRTHDRTGAAGTEAPRTGELEETCSE